MTTVPCGRIDDHDAHEWTRPQHACGPFDVCRPSTFRCLGAPVTEGGYWGEWDAEDDAAEERADREKRESA